MADALMFTALVAICVACRLVDHVPNFTPMAGVALFAGFWFARRRAALAIPLTAMLLSDVFLGAYEWRVMATVYASLLLPIAFRGVLRSRLAVSRVAILALTSSLAFYAATNFAHWLFFGMYEHTWAGLAACYLAALPFLKYQLAGDLLWTAGLFGAYAMASRAVAGRQAAVAG